MKRKGRNFTSIQEAVESKTSENILAEVDQEYYVDFEEIAEVIRSFDGKISVVSDYDVDGVMLSCIMHLLLKSLGKDFEIYVPRRMSDGYGISDGILDKIHGDLIITGDNGIAAVDTVKKAKERGKTVIILDHHLPLKQNGKKVFPPADYILDLEAGKGSADYQHYCGAGLAYKLVEYMSCDKMVRTHALVYAAIATVADMVELRFDNRKIVKQGLSVLNERNNKDTTVKFPNGFIYDRYSYIPRVLQYFLYKSENVHVSEKDIGFQIGPIINAAGRMLDNGGQYVYETFMCSKSWMEMFERVDHLFEINEARRDATTKAVEGIRKQIKENQEEDSFPLIVYYPGLEEGIVGLIAGRLAEEYQTVAIVLTDSKKEGYIKGSGRSYGDIDLAAALNESQDCLTKYGGHEKAAGVTLKKEMFASFLVSMKMQKRFQKKKKIQEFYDIKVASPMELNSYVRELEAYAPYGVGNPEPIFYIEDFPLYPTKDGYYKELGKKNEHISFQGKGIQAVGFHMVKKYQDMDCPRNISIYGNLNKRYLKYNTCNQVEILDFFPAKKPKRKVTALAEQLEFMASQRTL